MHLNVIMLRCGIEWQLVRPPHLSYALFLSRDPFIPSCRVGSILYFTIWPVFNAYIFLFLVGLICMANRSTIYFFRLYLTPIPFGFQQGFLTIIVVVRDSLVMNTTC